ncbi:MAG: N-acetylglucosaminyldiphosphoundecaprenol N-acetyl-beta-D-mannosaminyltransferase [Chroococcidiopsis cubana SAG 39.79]|jgi:N-acetylglucosaminyldiphosphoundecaprenol N-acetyl-beta-D-mannosaminyltransferase|uniref:Glycosyl transferase, WecB/TagA/CpsF family n=2 Tax=Chroococcidiopsis TaxID=54298 RepID=K9TU59_CHRTP|nr:MULTISPECIES: WecB/TagA/CpsF family glycosyltransferase [Chroococcidiopsis]AFY86357.1 glycosyl transferase, WecB/TagA/CpsF family [Chroococcidiopsis thermalis PCC 7203]MDZ4873613.1 N-acetylglucosaminyldiphosphoundecaprenol N-acetyl-beta-D-mannosaminyltransferase [Chroococcidiopsis cubana SAG 39.79]PSB56745.1 glycosyltransferase [Chroococcidiopsis cubana CCALA 043]RUT11790.1 UDP-N-acetyl-D-mannosaminuronic acid transferase [Chroococcidiopsis cubana SAG 39.79]
MKNTRQSTLNDRELFSEQHQIQNQSFETLDLEFRVLKVYKKLDVIDSPVSALPFESQINLILEWATSKVSKFVCVANTHMLVEAYWHPEFAKVLKNADLVTPDGMPLVWMLKLLGARTQNRVAGIDILLSLCKLAPLKNVSIFFLGSETPVLEKMRERLARDFPNLKIAGMEPLPFHPLTRAEDEALVEKIHHSGAGIVLVALGCPKQEYWMQQHQGKIRAVTIGLGGAFPVYAGDRKRAPHWLRFGGGEWLYRWLQEPLRLSSRYGQTIPVFTLLAFKQILLCYLVKSQGS